MGGTLKNLTMQVISGSMYKSMYIGHNVQEKVGPSKGKMSINMTRYSMKKKKKKKCLMVYLFIYTCLSVTGAYSLYASENVNIYGWLLNQFIFI